MDVPNWKTRCLMLAECIDAWRLIPRLLLVGYCIFVVQLTDRLLTWYTALEVAERSIEASGFAAAIFTAVTGFGTLFVNAYIGSGKKWNRSEQQ